MQAQLPPAAALREATDDVDTDVRSDPPNRWRPLCRVLHLRPTGSAFCAAAADRSDNTELKAAILCMGAAAGWRPSKESGDDETSEPPAARLREDGAIPDPRGRSHTLYSRPAQAARFGTFAPG